jgi:hypothetical protein
LEPVTPGQALPVDCAGCGDHIAEMLHFLDAHFRRPVRDALRDFHGFPRQAA